MREIYEEPMLTVNLLIEDVITASGDLSKGDSKVDEPESTLEDLPWVTN